MKKYLKEREVWWPVSPELMASYKDGSHTHKNRYGTLEWWNKNGEYHRDGDEPAVINTDGTLRWYKNGHPHRDGDKPAVINANRTLLWIKNGKRHRDGDRPTAIWSCGTMEWYKNGLPHRDGDEPAVIDAYGNMEWHKNGFRHRIMGPAVLHPNKKKQYWINGKNITIEANRWLKTKKYNEPFTLEQQVEFMLTFG